MITIQQKLFRLLKIFSPAMQDQKLASPVVASLQGEEQLVAAVLFLSLLKGKPWSTEAGKTVLHFCLKTMDNKTC